MRAGIVCHKIYYENELIERALKERGLEVKRLDPRKVLVEVGRKEVLLDGSWMGFDVVLSRVERGVLLEGYRLLKHFEAVGIPVINKADAVLLCQDKFLTYVALRREGVKVPRTFLAYEKEPLNFVDLEEAVFKPVVGGKGMGVRKGRVNEVDLDAMGSCVQEFLPIGGRDSRCLVVGGEVVGAIERIARPGEWRTNIALGAVACPYRVDRELEELCLKCCEVVGLDVAGVDVGEVDGERYVFEVNPTPLFKGLMQACRINPAEKIADLVVKRCRG